jgi:hypothetical protein
LPSRKTCPTQPPSPRRARTKQRAWTAKPLTAEKAEAKSDISLLPPAAVTQHSTSRWPACRSDHTAEAGTLALPGAGGKTAASIFYVAYTRDPKNAKRPITFVFNGGPGAAATYLHLGGIGPRAVEVNAKGELRGPPPTLTDNPSTWLDMTDLVFVDPVGTGYSRASETKDEEKFWGVEQDTDALADLFALSRSNRRACLAGVPHGREPWRSAPPRLPASCRRAGRTRHGIVLISPVLEFSALWRGFDPLLLGARDLLLAAVNLETKGDHPREALASGLKEAETYALPPTILVALASGAEAGGKAASGTVSRLTGLRLDVVERRQAGISLPLHQGIDRSNAQV